MSVCLENMFKGDESMLEGNQRVARIFKAFCDENRITILQLLQGGEKCACRLQEELSISQPTLSHHMRILCDAGIVNARKEGKWTHYSLNSEGSDAAIMILQNLLLRHNDDTSSEKTLPECES